LLLVLVWSFGGTAFGSSRLHVVMSISSGCFALSNVSGVPHLGQKLRVPWALELKRAGVPRTKRKLARGTLNHATKGAPLVRRQIEQWQLVSWNGAPAAS
jgi:hypothetical protein